MDTEDKANDTTCHTDQDMSVIHDCGLACTHFLPNTLSIDGAQQTGSMATVFVLLQTVRAAIGGTALFALQDKGGCGGAADGNRNCLCGLW